MRVILLLGISVLLILAVVATQQSRRRTVNSSGPRSFHADIPGPLPAKLTIEKIRSATQYLVMAHLVRPIVKRNRHAQIEGELADSWQIADGFKFYRFHISDEAKWSDGSKISSEQVATSFREGMKVGPTTHFDFRQIESVGTSGQWLELKFKAASPNLLPSLVHPETAVVRYKEGTREQDFTVTSGPYSVTKMNEEEIVLAINPYFPGIQGKAPSELYLSAIGDLSKQIEGLKNKQLGFMNPAPGLTPQVYQELKSTPLIQEINPHIGYTFWLAPDSRSPVFKTEASRQWLAKVVSEMQIDFSRAAPYWGRAQQLYLNDGFGRPSAEELSAALAEINSASPVPIKRLRILISRSFPFAESLYSLLKLRGIEVEPLVYNDFQEFEALLKKGGFDVFQINNDFSSSDVLENLLVTFSESRPLVSVGKDAPRYRELLNRTLESQDSSLKHSVVKEIGLSLLRQGYVIPIAYRNTVLFADKDWDFSGWSILFPDVRFWKIKPATTGDSK